MRYDNAKGKVSIRSKGEPWECSIHLLVNVIFSNNKNENEEFDFLFVKIKKKVFSKYTTQHRATKEAKILHYLKNGTEVDIPNIILV